MSELSHLDPSGAARMVDVSDKPATARAATAVSASISTPVRSVVRTVAVIVTSVSPSANSTVTPVSAIG